MKILSDFSISEYKGKKQIDNRYSCFAKNKLKTSEKPIESIKYRG